MAQADKPIPRPEFKVDDRWVYLHTDKRMKPPSFVYELRVSFVDSRIDKVASDEARKTFGYVPQVKRWVKSVYQDARIEVVEELYFYRVQ